MPSDRPITAGSAGSPVTRWQQGLGPAGSGALGAESAAGTVGAPGAWNAAGTGDTIAARGAAGSRDPGGRFGAGSVTGALIDLGQRSRSEPDLAPPPDPAVIRRRTMRWFAGSAGGIVAIGIVILLTLTLSGHSPFPPSHSGAPDTRPILAKLCPPPSAGPAPGGAVPATPSGRRTVDDSSGISYRAYGAPWRTWDMAWETNGQLGVVFRTGQFFVTEPYPGGQGDYLATILSGSVPAATNDALTLDLECAGHQVTADVRQAYYPQPNTMDTIVDKATTLGGRPAWLSEFDLHFHVAGLKATDEMVAIALLDVGKPNASILYISIPGTHRQFDYVIDQLLASVRPT
jgi:hypothetical protein